MNESCISRPVSWQLSRDKYFVNMEAAGWFARFFHETTVSLKSCLGEYSCHFNHLYFEVILKRIRVIVSPDNVNAAV
jgi:hypothetical protein